MSQSRAASSSSVSNNEVRVKYLRKIVIALRKVHLQSQLLICYWVFNKYVIAISSTHIFHRGGKSNVKKGEVSGSIWEK